MAFLVLRDLQVPRARQAQLARQVLKDQWVPQVRQDQLARPAPMEPLEQRALSVLRVLLEARLVPRDLKAIQGQPAPQVPQALPALMEPAVPKVALVRQGPQAQQVPMVLRDQAVRQAPRAASVQQGPQVQQVLRVSKGYRARKVRLETQGPLVLQDPRARAARVDCRVRLVRRGLSVPLVLRAAQQDRQDPRGPRDLRAARLVSRDRKAVSVQQARRVRQDHPVRVPACLLPQRVTIKVGIWCPMPTVL
jgi:hypothetical protein